MKSKKWHPLVFGYLMYTLMVLNTEWINMGFKLMGKTLPFGIAESISLVIIAAAILIFRRKITISTIGISREILLSISIIAIFGFIMSVYPDQAFDTFNYHLIAQNPHFENYFTEDYGYGNFQVWGFRLGDRLFYYFRLILGYRLGTLLNTLILIIAFFQMYELTGFYIDKLGCDENVKRRWIYNRCVWTLGIILPLDAMLMVGCYYVDIIAFPVGLEIISVLLDWKEEQQAYDILYFALLNGVLVAFKLTHIVYAIPFVLIYIFFHFKEIHWMEWLGAIALGLFPFLDYLIFNSYCTGNPVFPYYNSLFQSPYYSTDNFIDGRWGGASLVEKIFWIVSAVVRPDYKQSEIPEYMPILLMIGLIGGGFLIVSFFRVKKKADDRYEFFYSCGILLIIAISSAVIWGLTTGYSRYYVFGKMLWGLIGFCAVLYLVNINYKIGKIITIICSFSIACYLCVNLYSTWNGRNWSYQSVSFKSFQAGMIKIFRDRDITTDYGIESNVYVLTSHATAGAADLVDDKAYMINAYGLDSLENIQKVASKKVQEFGKAYDIRSRDMTYVAYYTDLINKLSLRIADVSTVELGPGRYALIELNPMTGKPNTSWTFDQGDLELNAVEKTGKYVLSMISGTTYCWEDGEAMELAIFAESEQGERWIISIPINRIDPQIINTTVDLNEGEYLLLQAYDSKGELVPTEEANQIFIINLELSMQ